MSETHDRGPAGTSLIETRTGEGRAVYRPNRRRLLRDGGLLLAAAGIGMPSLRPSWAAERSLKVSTYGGYFEESFNKFVYPAFTKATGIAVNSVSQPSGVQFLIQLAEANRAGLPPMDLCTAAQSERVRGDRNKMWKAYDTTRIPNLSNLPDFYVGKGDSGVYGIGAMAWYMTLIINPEELPAAPDSWRVFWDASHPNAWGVSSGGNSYLFEITAKTWFGGTEILSTKEGILQVIAKMAELKPQVKLWWESEGTMQTAFENGEVIGGTYFHDVAGVMAKNGTPVKSIFPKEGGMIDFGSWCQPSASTKAEEACEFINFMCSPEAQGLMARNVGCAPIITRDKTDLTDAEFAAVSSEVPPIVPAIETRLTHLDFMTAEFTRMLTAS
ncbi:ABC transporter substrate-binding protein [Inquilinus sp. OTU3971]|uniref:ABC transporter substrate-binding protein n=1 Tax=Inquilinus sp. OTU3971 TaxID=3043855 RepID=UPI00313E7881